MILYAAPTSLSNLIKLLYKPYSTVLVTSYCALHKKYSLCALACRFYVSRKGGTGRGGWGHPQGAVHMAAAGLGCKRAMVGTGWANSHPGCMNRLRKHYSHLVGGLFLARNFKAAWALSSICQPRMLTIACMSMSGHG